MTDRHIPRNPKVIPMKDDDRCITVCDFCLRACCWQGMFMCDKAYSAGTTEKTVAELRKRDLEHSDYWKDPR